MPGYALFLSSLASPWLKLPPSFDNAYIHWINEVRAWTLKAAALEADTATEIGRRYLPQEPMVCPCI